MIHTSDDGTKETADDDVAYLRLMLKPFDPAEHPRSAFLGLRPAPNPGTSYPRVPRRRAGLLVAAATCAVVAAAALIPVLVLNRDTGAADQAQPAAAAFAECQHRAASASSPGSAGPTPGGLASFDASEQPADPASTRWYGPSKRDHLTKTLRAALPADTCVFPGSGMGDLRFPAAPNMDVASYDGRRMVAPTASGRLVTPHGDGTLMAAVYPAVAGPQSCGLDEAGEQSTTPDGTIVNQRETYAADAPTRWIVLLVQAYRPDGSCLWLRLSDEVLRHDTSPTQEGMVASGSTPLTMKQLTAIATTPGLETN